MSEALQALYEGDETRARELLRPDAEVTIFEAAAFGRSERLREILASDSAQVRALSDDGFTPLHLAVFGKSEDAVRTLIESGADLNQLSTGALAQVPPLGTAAFVGSVPLARLLLDAGADVNRQGTLGNTALHAAAQNGDLDLVRELLARGADRGIRMNDGKTAADLAANDEVRKLLVD